MSILENKTKKPQQVFNQVFNQLFGNVSKPRVFCRFIITCIFIYVLIHFLELSHNDWIYTFFTKYILNKYCIILYILITMVIYFYVDSYTGILLFILIIAPYKCAIKELYTVEINDMIILPSATNAQTADTQDTNPLLSSTQNASLINEQILGIDDRFKIDEIAKDEILKQIKAQVDFDPYKTNLDKNVIYEIYNKYFDNDIFVKLKTINDDSKNYIAAGNFTYLPKNNKVDYDLITYQNLSQNVQLGINPIIDGIGNKTRNV